MIAIDKEKRKVLENFLCRSQNIYGYHSLPASWWWSSNEGLELRSYSYSDTILKELGPLIRPFFFSRNNDKIDFEKHLLKTLYEIDLGNFQEDLDNLKTLYENLNNQRALFDMISNIENKNIIKVSSDEEHIGEVTLESLNKQSDKDYFCKILYGRVIHDSEKAKDYLDNISEASYVYVISSAIYFLQSAVILIAKANELLIKIGIRVTTMKSRLRPDMKVRKAFRPEEIEGMSISEKMKETFERNDHFSPKYIDLDKSKITPMTEMSLGDTFIFACYEYENDRNIFIYSNQGKITETEERFRFERGENELTGRLVIWDPKTLYDGMLYRSKNWWM